MPETLTPAITRSDVVTIPLTIGGGRRSTDEPGGRYRRGDSIDEYVIERLIAKHRLAEVYSARGKGHEHVAIKIFIVGRSEALQLFKSELKVAVTLHHPNVLEFVNVGPGDNEFYLVMPFCEHGTLADWLRTREQIRVEDAIAVLYQLASALECTHAKNIVHGDLSPTNIAVSSTAPPTFKIFDFEFATLTGCPIGKFGYVCGTLLYVAPERLLGNVYATPAQDMFSVGAIAAEVVTGLPLFQIDDREWPPRRNTPDLRLVAALAPQLHAVVTRLLSERPEDRLTASEVVAMVGPLMTNIPSLPARETQITK